MLNAVLSTPIAILIAQQRARATTNSPAPFQEAYPRVPQFISTRTKLFSTIKRAAALNNRHNSFLKALRLC